MLAWVPLEPIAEVLAGLDSVRVEGVAPDHGSLPGSASEVEFYVPPFFPGPAAIAAMAQLPRLRVVQPLTAGIDLLRPHVPGGALLCNARGVHDASTAEWVVAAVLASVRQFPYFAGEQAAGRWGFRFTGCLAGKTVLIVGYGSIGAAGERRLSGFVARMKDGALLVNAARGSLLRTDALCAELQSGRLHAALDVTDPEPLEPGHPLWDMPNVLITPHVAASTPVSASTAVSFVREQAQRFLTGQPLENVITGEY